MARERQPLTTDRAFINHANWMMEDSEYKRFVQNVKRSALEKGIDRAYQNYKSGFRNIFDWGDPEQYAINDTIYLKGVDFTAQKFFDIHTARIFYVQIGKSRQLRYRDTITGRFVKQK